MSGLTDYQEFVNDMSASSYFTNWKKQNPKEYTTWAAFNKGVQDGSQPTPPVLKTKFGQGMVDGGIMYLNAWDHDPIPVPPDPTPPDPTPPDPTPPDPTPPASGTPFQRLWDATKPPQRSWNNAITITSQAAFQTWLNARKANDHVIVKGFTYNGRCEIRGGSPFWIESDPTFQIVNPVKGSVNFGLWMVNVNGAVITGFPRMHDCGNQGFRGEGCRDIFVELDCSDNGGNGALVNDYNGRPSGVHKIRGGGNGRGCMPPGSPGYEAAFYSADIDPHAQKGTGTHFMNSWALDPGSVVLCDITKDQAFGAGLESTGYQGTSAKPIIVAVRATSLSCDVNRLPASPSGGRQAGGNAWQPWGDQHSNVQVKSIEVGGCARGVEPLGSFSNCVVEYGRIASARLSPRWPSFSGIAYQDISPRP
jgi:hypothetical protein